MTYLISDFIKMVKKTGPETQKLDELTFDPIFTTPLYM